MSENKHLEQEYRKLGKSIVAGIMDELANNKTMKRL